MNALIQQIMDTLYPFTTPCPPKFKDLCFSLSLFSSVSAILTKSKDLCPPGQKQSGSKCICMSPEEDCSAYSEDLCIFDGGSSQYFTSSACKFLAGKCLNNTQSHFVHSGSCQEGLQLEWGLERLKLAVNSTKRVSCGYNTCYDWENCSVLQG